jgi:hypothetical protein
VPSPTQQSPLANSRKASLVTLVLVSGLALGLLGDVLLRSLAWGVGFGLWTLALAVFGAALIARRDGRLRVEQIVWLGVATVLAWTFALRDDAPLHLLTFVAIVAAFIGARTVAARSPVLSVVGARVRDVLRSAAAGFFDAAIGFPRLVLADAGVASRNPAPAGSKVLVAARPVFIAVPILLVFSVLLVQADPVFGSWFRLPDFEKIVEHAFVILLITWIVAGGLRGTILGGSNIDLSSLPPVRLGTAEVAAVLGGISLLFFAFVATQIGSLFGGEALVQRTTGLTYAEYARRGFFELVIISALLLPTLLIGRATLVDERSVRLFRRLSVVVVALLFAILISAVARLQLYVRYYGLTEDRLYAIAALSWLALVWIWFSATILRERPRLFAFGAIVAAYGVLAALHVVGPARAVARFNIERPRYTVATGSPIDYAYLAGLVGDASDVAPPLVDALLRPPLSAASSEQRTHEVTSRCRAVGSLMDWWQRHSARFAKDDWRSWNLARSRAGAALRRHERELRQTPCIVNGQPVSFEEFQLQRSRSVIPRATTR